MKTIIASVLAILITVATAWYQRVSGPTYPKKMTAEFNGKYYRVKLPRSHESDSPCEVRIPLHGRQLQGQIIYKRYPTNNAWDTVHMQTVGDELVGALPAQPPAGKLMYFLELNDGEMSHSMKDHTAVIRFKGSVPALVLIPHIIFMFLAMLFSNLAGLQAAFRISRMRFFMVSSFIALVIGGLILGPLVQHFAFGAYWTGFPNGYDLTDNKVLINVIVWLIVLLLNIKKPRPAWIIVAAVVTLIVYCIPHSLFGSELNYATGIITTG